MSWFDRFARALYEVSDKDPVLYYIGTVCLVVVLIAAFAIIAKFVPWLFAIAFVVGMIAIVIAFIRAIVNNMKNDTD